MGEPTYSGGGPSCMGLGLKARVKARATGGGIPMYEGGQLS
uniref:RDR3 n=1 Tax=Arundo donax TaxID=35708 RepID=A0A0A9DJJ6_ARUDO